MSAEKKKLLILGAVAFAILCIGVFQFTGSSKKQPETASKATTHHSARQGTTAPETAQPAPVTTAVNEGTTGAPGAPTNAPGALTNSQNTTGNPAPGAKNLPAAQPVPAVQTLAERDPFDGARYQASDTPKATPTPTPRKAAPIAAGPKIPPLTLTGDLTGAKGQVINLPSGQLKDTFDYTVSGVITGDKPAAIFTDSKGNQRLIQLGGSLDGDTKVVSVSRGKVTVSHHGKTKTLTVGADNPTEKRSDEK